MAELTASSRSQGFELQRYAPAIPLLVTIHMAPALPPRDTSRFERGQGCTGSGPTCYAYASLAYLPCERCHFSSQQGVASKAGYFCCACMHETVQNCCKRSKSLYWWAEQWEARVEHLKLTTSPLLRHVRNPPRPVAGAPTVNRHAITHQSPPDHRATPWSVEWQAWAQNKPEGCQQLHGQIETPLHNGQTASETQLMLHTAQPLRPAATGRMNSVEVDCQHRRNLGAASSDGLYDGCCTPTQQAGAMGGTSWLDGARSCDSPKMALECNPSHVALQAATLEHSDGKLSVQTPQPVCRPSLDTRQDKWAEVLTCLRRIDQRVHNLEAQIEEVHVKQNRIEQVLKSHHK